MNETQDREPDSPDDLVQLTCAVRTNGINTIVIPSPALAYIRLLVLDEDERAVADAPYKLLDQDAEVVFEGRTGAGGMIDHDDATLDDHTLVLGGFVASVPAVAHPEERCTVFLPELGYIRLAVMSAAEAPFAGAPYDIEVDGLELLSGATDAAGEIRHDFVPLGDYALFIGTEPIIVPAVNHEDEMVSVFLRASADDKDSSGV